MILIHRRWPGVVCRQRQRNIIVIARQQLVQICRPAGNILIRPKRILQRPSSLAVPGISCIRPRAPVRETARTCPPLSARTTLASRSASMLCSTPA